MFLLMIPSRARLSLTLSLWRAGGVSCNGVVISRSVIASLSRSSSPEFDLAFGTSMSSASVGSVFVSLKGGLAPQSVVALFEVLEAVVWAAAEAEETSHRDLL